jgi:hypothetical protein
MASDTIPLFVMQQPTTFKWPVRVAVPVDGQYKFAEFTGVFPNKSEEELQLLMPKDAAGTPQRTDLDLAMEVLVGFEDVKAPDGTALPYTDENKAALLKGPRVANAVLGTFLMAVRGLAAEKNS